MSLCCLTPTSYQLMLGNYPWRSTSFRKPIGQQFSRRSANLVWPTLTPRASLIDINIKWNTLKKQMNDIVDTCIPSKMTTKRHKAPWINGTLIRLTRKKQRLFNKANKKKGNNTWSRYKSCNKQVTQQMRKARSDCVNKIIESAFQEADTKLFWKLIHSKRGEKLESCHWSPRGNCFLTADQKLRL